MADLRLTPKQEAFCQAIITEPNSSAAYRKAYPKSVKWKDKTVHEMACRLRAKVKVYARVHELQADQAERSAVSVESLTADTRRIMAQADELGHTSAAVSAVNLIAKMHGLLVDRMKVEPVTIKIERSYD